jgi:hypothetical protein
MFNGFTELVFEPTRLRNILDIVLCNHPLIICDLSVTPLFGNSDHNQVQFSVFTYDKPHIESEDCEYHD